MTTLCLMDQGGGLMQVENDITGTLRKETHGHEPVVAIRTAQTSANGHGIAEDVAHTLDLASGQAVAQVQWASGGGQIENDTAQSLRSGAEHNYQFARIGYKVRRLTPVECSRLQGFPDDYLSQVPYRGKCPPPDGVMYKALGNSMAVNCMAFIAQRIAMYEAAMEAGSDKA